MEWLYAIYRRNRSTLINYLSGYGIAIKAEKIFALVIESGFAYCCVWVRSFLKKKRNVFFRSLY